MPQTSPAKFALLSAADPERARRFEVFLAAQRDLLVAFLRYRTVSEADAQDAAQESMVKLVRYRDRKPDVAWKPLLYRIAVNVAHDQARRRHRLHEGAHDPIDKAGAALSSGEPSHEKRVDDERELIIIRELILQLPGRCRQVYLLNRIDGMSYSQVARQCGISVKAVEKHVAKALKFLRKGLRERGISA